MPSRPPRLRRPTGPRPARSGLGPLLGPLLVAAAAGAGAGGCEGNVGEAPGRRGPGNVSTRDPQLDALSQSAELVSRVKHVLNAYCADCHSGREGRADGGFGFIFDAQKMQAAGIVELGNPAGSKLITRVRDDSMPPPDEQNRLRPTEQDIKLLELWIKEGTPAIVATAQRARPDANAVLAAMQADLAKVGEAARDDVRYVSLASLIANPNIADRELEAYENAVSKLVNSLSTSSAVVRPSPVADAEGRTIALRIRLSDYGWNDADWGIIERATQLVDRTESPCDVAYLNADALVATASSDNVPLADGTITAVYSNVVLKNWLAARGVLPPGEPVFPDGAPAPHGWGEIEGALGIDAASLISANDGRVIRAGVSTSGETASNRIVERYTTADGGYYWRTYDFSSFSGNDPLADVFRTPVGPAGQVYKDGAPLDPGAVRQFAPAGGAGFFGLPNGLQAYVVVDAAGRMMRAADRGVSGDPLNVEGGRANENGGSCLRCHNNGVAEVDDQLREVVSRSKAAFSNYEVGFVLSLHPPAETLRQTVEADAGRFRQALREAQFHGTTSGPLPDGVFDLAALYRGFHDVSSVASEFLVDDATLRRAAERLARDKPALKALLVEGGGLRRAALTAHYRDLRDELGVGAFGTLCVKAGPPPEPPPEPEPTPEPEPSPEPTPDPEPSPEPEPTPDPEPTPTPTP